MISLKKCILLTTLVVPTISLFAMDDTQENMNDLLAEKREILQQLQAAAKKKAQNAIYAMQQAMAHSPHKTPTPQQSPEAQSTPPSKLRKLGDSPDCHSGTPFAQPQASTSPIKTPPAIGKTGNPQCPNLRHTRATQNVPEKRSLKARAIKFTSEGDACNPPEPAPKRSRVEQYSTPVSVETVFNDTFLLPHILGYDGHTDLFRCARVTKNFNQEVQKKKYEVLADEIIKHAISPITYVLKQAHNQEVKTHDTRIVYIHGIKCETKELVATLLLKNVDPLNELKDNDSEPILKDSEISVAPEVRDLLAPFNLTILKPIKFVPITDYLETEEQVVAKVAAISNDFPNHLLALDFNAPHEIAYFADITESLIEKLAPYPIFSIHVEANIFPQGLACLAKLKSLKELHLDNCTLLNDEIDDEFLAGLPELNVLEVTDSDMPAISSEINNMKHLVALDLHGNNLQTIPSLQNLRQLKVLDLVQNNENLEPHDTLSATQLAQCLPVTSGLIALALSYNGNQDPLPAGCHLNQLRVLHLDGNKLPFQNHWNELQNLESLTLEQFPFQQIPDEFNLKCPRLKWLSIFPDDTVTIGYIVLKILANQLEFCAFFELSIDQIRELKAVACLWNWVKIQSSWLAPKIEKLSDEMCKGHETEVATIRMLLKNNIRMDQLRDLMTNPEKRQQCNAFITDLYTRQT